MPLPPRALPRRFRQPRLLLVGCGDVAARVARQLHGRYRIRALLRHDVGGPEWIRWRSLGTTPIQADLDQPVSLKRLRGIADKVIYLAPPADTEAGGHRRPLDPRLNRFLATLHGGLSLPRHRVLISTTGVYGDQQGAMIDETCPVQPKTVRGLRRLHAEQTWRHWERTHCATGLVTRVTQPQSSAILRVPGIYAGDRLPIDRLRAGTPALREADDTWTNHIHAEDLARISWLALYRCGILRTLNASDNSQLKMGDWFDAVADAHGLPRPERLPRAQLQSRVSPMMYSFMSESRRLDNSRLKQTLRLRLIYPTVHDFLATLSPSPGKPC
jgi:nucleoside-diphosphate-sugar epimerase